MNDKLLMKLLVFTVLVVIIIGFVIWAMLKTQVDLLIEIDKDGWETCDEEVYLHYGEEVERFDLYWDNQFNRIDYKTVPNGIDLIFYEEDGGDIFDVVVRGQYTFLCATDRDEVE